MHAKKNTGAPQEISMSVSRFPNATSTAAEKLVELLEKLLPNPHQTIADDVEIIFSAHICEAVEIVINMQQLPLYHSVDPALLTQIKSLLNSCR